MLDTSGLTEERSGQESLLGVGRQCGVTGTGTCFVCHINTQHGVITLHTQDQTVRCQVSGVRWSLDVGQFSFGLRAIEELRRFSLLSTKYPFLFIKECEEHLYTGADSIGTIVTCVQMIKN